MSVCKTDAFGLIGFESQTMPLFILILLTFVYICRMNKSYANNEEAEEIYAPEAKMVEA